MKMNVSVIRGARAARRRGIARMAFSLAAVALLAATGIVPAIARDAAPAPQPRASLSYVNGAVQTIPDGAQVDPVSTIVVPANFRGSVVDVDVKLRSLDHGSPQDLAVMVVGPRGQAVVLMGDAGQSGSLNGIVNTYLTFDDQADSMLPEVGFIISGTYKPSNYLTDSAIFTSGAPVPNEEHLSAFNGVDPRGVWSLYVLDDQLNNVGGRLAAGWELHLTTSNTKPHAVNHKYRTGMDKELKVNRKFGLLRKATDRDGKDTIRVKGPLTKKDDKGTMKIARDGSFTFTPKEGVTGKVVFTYTIIDDHRKTDSAKVVIYIDR